MTEPTAIDGSEGPLATRRIVVWRRLEPGDVRTPGTELAPESPHLEARIVEVGIDAALHVELERLWKARDEVMSVATRWSARYEPAGVMLAVGGTMAVGVWLDYLPAILLSLAGGLVALGAALGMLSKVRKKRSELDAERRWRDMPERDELAKIERRLAPRWERFATKLREDTGFRTDVRVGDIHEADRLVSIDPTRLTHPDTWRADAGPAEVRYAWAYADGRAIEQRAELEDDEASTAPAQSDEEAGDEEESDEEESDESDQKRAR